MPQSHLELAGVQGVVPAKIPELSLPRHPEGPFIHALTAHPDALGRQAGIAEGGHAVGAHPVVAAVVLLLLLLHALFQHALNFFLAEPHVFQGLLLVPVGVVLEHVRPVEPVHQLLRHLLLKGHVLEVLEKTAVEAVEIRLALHQKRPA